MADILIKGMELPKTCDDCLLCLECEHESFDYCRPLKATTTRGKKRNDCPLVELPSHGRLLEELIADYQQTHKCDIDTATYYTMAFLVDAVASGMSSLEGMHKRIFVEASNGSDN